ncbi:MAG: SDR family NAD(P)-dependent oxidoreductase [Sphingomonadales bacterium]|nr:MAG: SDR family NAD(P)-dependent oxidoreductase [Sphingomonadales bacterium]
MSYLEGRVAVVTGAGRGIGAAVATLLAKLGAHVVVNDLGVKVDGSDPDQTPAQSVVDDIVAAGGSAIANYNDVSDFDAAERIIQSAIDNFGKLDILINVAGILRDRMIFNMSEAEWDAVIDVHLKGTFNTTRHASAYWRKNPSAEGHHRIINFISAAGLYGIPGQPNYSAAKAGMVGLTFSCANALAKYGVTANAVAPAAATRMGQTVPADRDRPERAVFQTDEYGPQSIAPLAGYLAGLSSGWCTGRVLGARGHRVLLYSNPEPIRYLVADQQWDVERLGKTMEEVFQPLPSEYNPFAAARPAK